MNCSCIRVPHPSRRLWREGGSLKLRSCCRQLCGCPILRRRSLATGWAGSRFGLLLIDVRLGHSDCQRPNAGDHAHALGHADRAARVQNVEQVRALQAEVEGAKDREARVASSLCDSLARQSRIGSSLFAFRSSPESPAGTSARFFATASRTHPAAPGTRPRTAQDVSTLWPRPRVQSCRRKTATHPLSESHRTSPARPSGSTTHVMS